MYLYYSICFFIFGTVIGSFLNVCIFRIPNEQSIAFPPSHCGSCNHKLSAKDLIPILSWVFLKGKCRYCKAKVSIQYPLIEAITGCLFLALYLKFGLTVKLIKYIVLTALFIVIGIIDFKTQDVYDSTIIFGIVVAILFIIISYFVGEKVSLLSIILGSLIPAGIIAIFAKFGAMGWGDVEIIFVSGLFLGFKLSMVNLFLSIVIGGAVACLLMIMKKKGGKDMMAFGPWIALSTYIVIIFGNEMLNWYLKFF